MVLPPRKWKAKVLVTQSCPTLLDCSLPGSSVHGIPSLGDLPDPGVKPGSLALQADFLLSEPPGKPLLSLKEIASITGNEKYSLLAPANLWDFCETHSWSHSDDILKTIEWMRGSCSLLRMYELILSSKFKNPLKWLLKKSPSGSQQRKLETEPGFWKVRIFVQVSSRLVLLQPVDKNYQLSCICK